MLIIKQGDRLDGAKHLIKDYGRSSIELDRAAIIDAINYTTKIKENVKTATSVINASNIIKYLEGVLKNSEKEIMEILVTKAGKIETVPINMISVPNFQICTSNFIKLVDKAILKVEYSRLIDAITFELAHNDYEITMEDAERFMGHIGVISIYKSEELEWAMQDSKFTVTSGMKIGSTDYVNVATNKYTDYFGNDVEDIKGTNFYTKMCSESARRAMAIILMDTLENLENSGLKEGISVVGVYDNTIDYLVDRNHKSLEQIVKIVSYSVAARIFGRQFEFNPTVQVI